VDSDAESEQHEEKTTEERLEESRQWALATEVHPCPAQPRPEA
jgi:hypothetical protein